VRVDGAGRYMRTALTTPGEGCRTTLES
jgi:hypothetical protein